MAGILTEICKPQHDIYNPRLGINKPIGYLQGLTVRKVANIIHNSLMLVENPEEINYNTTARLYRLLTQEFDGGQKTDLRALINNYCEEDADFKKRMTELNRFQLSRKRDLFDKGVLRPNYEIKSADDFAANVMADIMFNTAKANATFDIVTKKSGNLNIESIVGSYIAMLPELTQKGINIDNALNSGLKDMDAQLGMYKKQVAQFMDNYVGLRKEHDRTAIKLAIKDGNGETRIEEGAEKFIKQHQENSKEVFVDETHTVVGKDDMKGKSVFNATNKDLDMLLDGINALNG